MSFGFDEPVKYSMAIGSEVILRMEYRTDFMTWRPASGSGGGGNLARPSL